MKIVLTGAPGSGKTTLIESLGELGEQTVPEAAIDVIQALVKEMGLSEQDEWRRGDPLGFQQRIYRHQTELEAVLDPSRRSFLDRGTLDGLAYLEMFNTHAPESFKVELAAHHYDHIFFIEPLNLDDLDLRQESGRNDSVEEAAKLVELLQAVYRNNGYTIHRIPPLPVAERVQYVLDLANSLERETASR